MSRKYALKANTRERAGKGIARALRREDKIPAVIYGDKKDPVLITLPANETNVEYYKGHMFTSVCDMQVDSEKHVVLARDVQLHPVTDKVEHVDFLRVTKKTKIAVGAPVHFLNEEESPGLKDGGTLNVVRHEVEILCPAMEIPEYIEVDLASAEIGDTIKSDQITLPEGMSFVITGRDFSIATIVPPKTIEEEEAEEAEAMEGIEASEAAEGGEETSEGGDEGLSEEKSE